MKASRTRGSPPRMRGKEKGGKEMQTIYGITPAYAGKSLRERKKTMVHWDHPRVCGEKVCLCCCDHPVIGSPPRMRGKEKGISFPASKVGITPAYAGKRSSRDNGLPAKEDHPRVCGEKYVAQAGVRRFIGSPPRMRGKVAPKNCGSFSTRITPAYAGKSNSCCPVLSLL